MTRGILRLMVLFISQQTTFSVGARQARKHFLKDQETVQKRLRASRFKVKKFLQLQAFT